VAEDDRTFMRELLLRFGKHQDAVLAELVESRKTWQAELRTQRESWERELRAQRETWQRESQDMRAEIQAQTQALLRVIDRMDRLDGGSATA
jgi:thiamine pyrophosphate-dependent acetolactate synthase large subunit-like protein